jgi:hypothetical protein
MIPQIRIFIKADNEKEKSQLGARYCHEKKFIFLILKY